MTELRSCIFIDQLQPNTRAHLGMLSRGYAPLGDMATVLIDVTPALDAERLADIALKSVNVKPSLLQLDSRGGWLGLHSHSTSEVKAVTSILMDELGVNDAGSMKVKVISSQIVSRLDSQHAFLLNRSNSGSLCLPGESLFMLDCMPATAALLAANEAEKAADIKIVNMRITGSMGRLYLSGKDEEIRVAADAAEQALNRLGEI